MKVITPPQNIDKALETISGPSLFLGGSIEMGAAEEWQNRVIAELMKLEVDGLVLNPRRADWDSTWEQKIGNPNFKEQVQWEISAIEAANKCAFYFDPNTKSPITLFELGLASGTYSESLVYCPDPFWRKGNVDVYCDIFRHKQVTTYEEFIYELKKFYTDFSK